MTAAAPAITPKAAPPVAATAVTVAIVVNGFSTAKSNAVLAVGCDEAADFAESMVGGTRNYNVLMDNCHQFSAGCLTKDPENYNNFLWFLKDEAKKRLGADNWRLWDKNYW